MVWLDKEYTGTHGKPGYFRLSVPSNLTVATASQDEESKDGAEIPHAMPVEMCRHGFTHYVCTCSISISATGCEQIGRRFLRRPACHSAFHEYVKRAVPEVHPPDLKCLAMQRRCD
ncbi:hypothetical protein OCU04_000259 [Sclerotinia nivalis]|uniref:Uncharacterized protein n=1 Tax=Sclerotinia nivalis TaxID=352851 RepID=A0A9X0AVW8_9HELO|nr:hypothetical protein OCU04_000259 [Sclerotinia nivalis]